MLLIDLIPFLPIFPVCSLDVCHPLRASEPPSAHSAALVTALQDARPVLWAAFTPPVKQTLAPPVSALNVERSGYRTLINVPSGG